MSDMLGLDTQDAFDHETLRVTPHGGDVPTQLTETIYRPANADAATSAYISVEGGSIRYWADKKTPTDKEGHLVEPKGTFPLDSYNLIRGFRAVRVGPTRATLQVSYLR